MVSSPTARFAGIPTIVVVLLTLFVSAADVVLPRWLEVPGLVFLGRISFYIVHFAVLGLLRPLAAELGANVALLAVAALTLAIASASCTFQ